MKVIVTKNYNEMCQKAARIIAAQITLKEDSVLGLATGCTPIGIYEDLVQKYEDGRLDFSEVVTVNLDEYVGLGGDHEQSYRYFMNQHLFDHVNIPKQYTYVPNGLCEDVEDECDNYELLIQQLGGIDLQLLGLGTNGHIGFNEPSDHFEAETHVCALSSSTIEANSRFFEQKETMPKSAITVGVGTIMQARKILLVANGENKAKAVQQMLFGPVSPQCPASILRFHQDVTVIVDEAAFSLAAEQE